MSQIELPKGRAKFILGIDNVNQLTSWLSQNNNIIGLAFVGRSNVGKSSTINALFGKNTARTSNTPGRTRQINVFEFELDKFEPEEPFKFYLFDLPGYGHAKVSKSMGANWRKLMDAFFTHLSQNIALLNIQDARHPNQDSDKEFHQYIKVFDNETFLVLNKSDKLKKQSERAKLKNMLPNLLKDYKWVSKFFISSAEKKDGIKEIHDAIIVFLLNRFERMAHKESTSDQ